MFLFSFPLEACVERGKICHPTNRRRKGEKDVAQFCTGWMQGFRQTLFFCKRRFATHVVHSCLSMNTHRFWTILLTWVFFRVALLVERRTRNSKVVDLNPSSSSQSPNEARATNRWRGQDSREPRKKTFFIILLANPYPERRVVYGSATDGGVLYTGKRREDATLVFFLSSLPRRRWMQGKDIEEVFWGGEEAATWVEKHG